MCECPRGVEICHHIGATMLAAHYRLSKTDVSCSWLPRKSRGDNQLKTISEIYGIPKQRRLTHSNLKESDIDELVERLNQLPPVGFAWLLKKESAEDVIVKQVIDIQSVLLSNDFAVAENQTSYLTEVLKLLPSKIIEIAEATPGQKNKMDWYTVRRLRISSSSFGVLIDCILKKRYPQSLYKRLAGKFWEICVCTLLESYIKKPN